MRLRVRVSAALLGAAFMAGCAGEPVKVTYRPKAKSKEYFSERDYGVKASPRVIAAALHLPGVRAVRMPRGGGREQVGKPYKIRGKWYYPREDMAYDKSGTASWYGAAFHGRRTANGEIYDMNQLSAAHPTMPLPSYARVTNLANGNSVIVRVNDRGPYAHSRLIDMSKRAAEMLDYTGSGTAQVRVQYVGRAPVEGNDDQYLMASFTGGSGTAEPFDPMQPNVLTAMAGPTPDLPGVAVQTVMEGEALLPQTASDPEPFALLESAGIPAVGPLVPDKPAINPLTGTPMALLGAVSMENVALAAYAEERISSANSVSAPFQAMGLTESRIKAVWKRTERDAEGAFAEFILLGAFDADTAAKLAGLLSGFADLEQETDGRTVMLSLHANGTLSLDQLLQKSWALGAGDAFIVRN